MAIAAAVLLVSIAAGTTSGPPAAAQSDGDELAGTIFRLYRGFFVRDPDPQGLADWHCLVSSRRASIGQVADAFTVSEEFQARYGMLGSAEAIDLAYRNLFDRAPDPAGRRYWLDRMAAGLTVGRFVLHLTESTEFRERTAHLGVPAVDQRTSGTTTCGETLVVWIGRGLPAGFAERVAALPSVVQRTTVHGDLVPLVRTDAPGGAPVAVAPPGWAWPIDALAIDPASFAQFQPAPDRQELADLRPGHAVLTRSSAELRGVGIGGVLTFRGGTVAVAGVVEDRSGSGAEVLVHRDDAARLGIDTPRFLLLRDTDRRATEAGVRASASSGSVVAMAGTADARFLREAHRVDPMLLVKRTFGEFLFRDATGRDIEIDAGWERANIVTESVPLLGRIRCHRLIVPAVRAAMAEVAAAGAGASVDPRQFAGCYNPRRIQAGEALSRHAWGIALDINVGANPRGDVRTQHPTLIAAMRSRGFAWGGDWEYPDPAHYEAQSGR